MAGLGALAEGFIAGSQLGMQMNREERAAAEAGELSKLREAAEGRATAQEGRAASAETRAQEQHKKSLSLQDLQERRFDLQEKRFDAQDKRAQAQEGRLDKQLNWQMAKEQRAEQDSALSSMAPIEYQRVASGGDFSPEFMEKAKGTRFDPAFMAKTEYKDAAKSAFEHVDTLMTKLQKEGPNSVGLADVNKPEFLKSLDVLMKPDIERDIGTKDPVTGKTIASKEIATVIPYENKGLVIDVKVTLDDGTSYIAPVTEGRSTDPDDPVKIIPIDKFINTIEGHTRMASAYNQPDLQNAVLRYVQPAKENQSAEVTKRQLLSEQASIDRDEAKELAKVNTDKVMEPEEKTKAMKGISDRYQEVRDRTNARYGIGAQKPVGKGSAAVQKASGGGERMMDTAAWAGNDPKKAAFIKSGEEYASTNGVNPFDSFTPDELQKIYVEWVNDQEADDIASQLSQ